MSQKATLIAVVTAIVTLAALEYAELVSALWVPAIEVLQIVTEGR